jgi:hypothetical protein
MQGGEFLQLARELVVGTAERHWRGTAIHAYYAVFLECREALSRWGITIARHQNIHHAVRLKLLYAQDADLKAIADHLDWLVRQRNSGSYDLGSLKVFANNQTAQDAIIRATDALAMLDAIEADPARRAAAIASLPP